jgi:DNA modification methylase
MSEVKLYLGDCLEVLKTLAPQSVQCVVTSPPYYGLRDYGVDGQIGLEQSPDEYVQRLVDVFREIRRVLKDDGTVFLNLGDSYVGSNQGAGTKNPTPKQSSNRGTEYMLSENHTSRLSKVAGLKPKDLIGIPWRVAFALQADGWYLRSDIIWHKPNPMPESVKDRPTKSHEYIFLLTKSARYYYDYQAVLEPANYDGRKDTVFKGSLKYDADTLARVGGERWPNKIRDYKTKEGGNGQSPQHHGKDIPTVPARNKRSVWTVNTQPFKGAHFAVFPPKLIEPCVLAGSKVGDIVLDPFNGAGTTGVVAVKYGRDYIGIELNPDYIAMSEKKINKAKAQMRLPI